MTSPVVDVIIAVHTATRPIARAVSSVIDHTHAPVRVNVIAHNIDPDIIRTNLGTYADHPGVRLLPYRDDIPSPAGPMNHGLDNATAPFTALLGSDDEFAPGAIDSWLNTQHETGATAVIPKIMLLGTPSAPLPPIRRGSRARDLSPSLDRLTYRSAPLGLVKREEHGHLRFVEGIGSGEDIPLTVQLWFTARNIAVDLRGPAYLVHEDEADRVTSEPRSVTADFAFLDAIDTSGWFIALPPADRVAIVSKLLRIHYLSAITVRRERVREHQDELRATLSRLLAMAPGALRVLSRVDRKIIDEALSAAPDAERILALSYDRWNARSLGVLLTRNPLWSLHPQAMLRLLRDARRVGTE